MFRIPSLLHRAACSLVIASVGLGCAEAKTSDGGADTGGAGGALAEGGAGGTGSTTNMGGTGGSAPTRGPDPRIHEISATDDWIELFNAGDEEVDLSHHVIADASAPGEPKLDEGAEFPNGTTLAPGAYLFVLAKQNVDPGKQDPQTDCDPGPSPCFYAPFGLSDTDGDEVFLVDSDGDIVVSAEYPASGVDADETWCQLPNDAETFEACAPTPGAANQAP